MRMGKGETTPGLPILGIGGKMIAWGLVYIIAVIILTFRFPEKLIVKMQIYRIFAPMDILLLLAGVLLLVASVRQIVKHILQGELVTDSVYACVRNPLYAAWILLILPGLALLSRVWLTFGLPLVIYFVYRFNIKEEDAVLEEKFGETYLAYKQNTNGLVPSKQALFHCLHIKRKA